MIRHLSVALVFCAACSKTEPAPSATPGSAADGQNVVTPVSASKGAPIAIDVNANGYTPAEVSAPAGKTVQLVFRRTSDEGCGQQLVFPSLNIRKDLPLNKPVVVDVPMPASGKVAFTCGMDMYKGSVVAQ